MAYGFVCNEASNGLQALKAAKKLVPDAVIMDIGIPVMNGIDATARLKADPTTREIPALAFTGCVLTRLLVLPQQRQRASQ